MRRPCTRGGKGAGGVRVVEGCGAWGVWNVEGGSVRQCMCVHRVCFCLWVGGCMRHRTHPPCVYAPVREIGIQTRGETDADKVGADTREVFAVGPSGALLL